MLSVSSGTEVTVKEASSKMLMLAKIWNIAIEISHYYIKTKTFEEHKMSRRWKLKWKLDTLISRFLLKISNPKFLLKISNPNVTLVVLLRINHGQR